VESSILKRLAIPILLFLLAMPLFIPKVKAIYSFTFYGAYYDSGLYAGAVNCTFWRIEESPVNFELEGEYTVGAEQLPAVLQVHLAYNESRTIYLPYAEDLYVFIPEEANLYTYYFQVLDFVGVTNGGYIEIWLNVNGTSRLIERQTLALMNDIPFHLSWSYTYEVAIYHPDYGRGFVGTYVAGSKTTFLIAITREIFPTSIPSSGGITRSCLRNNGTWVQFYYADSLDQTNWVHFSIYPVGSSTPIAEQNSTSEPVSWNYYDLAPEESYIGLITISHETLGTYYWSWVLPATETIGENPFVFLDTFGEDFPFPLRYLPAILMILGIFMAFTWWNLPTGIVVGYLFAAFLTYLGWTPFSWDWLWVSGCISFIIAFGLAKEREGGMY